MIPKIIHYCWFGANPLPKLAQNCIASWQKFLPDYEIKRWDETNFDLTICDYVKEAYQAKKWAFVSDYARFFILYKYGGVYFDTDVEIIKPLNEILERGPFMGIEQISPQISVAPGLGLAANSHLPLYQEILDGYHKKHFTKSDGSLDLTTVVTYTTEILQKHGLKNCNEIQQIAGVYIYPKTYFNPIDHVTGKKIITPNTYAIHHYMASWCTSVSRKRGKIYQFLARYLGQKNANRTKRIWRTIRKQIVKEEK